MTTAVVKKWADFQHYKNRCPPWIKLQKSILDDFDFACLPLASKALAPMLWLLASESMDGSVRIDADWLAFRLRFTVADVDAGLSPLIDKGFLIVASAALAPCLQDACLEAEAEAEGEGEAKKPQAAKRKKPTKTLLADDFAVSDAVKAWAVSKGITRLDDHLESFKAKAKAKAYEYADWDAALMNAIRDDWAKLGTPARAKKRKQLGEGSSTNYGDKA